MVNLSSRPLSPIETCVLNKGMGFVPIPKYKPFNTQLDIFKLMRTIKLKKFFGTDVNKNAEISYLGPSGSKFIPNISDPMISAFERLVKRDIMTVESFPLPNWHNLSIEEKRAVDSLSEDQSIVIREADKGGAVVILD